MINTTTLGVAAVVLLILCLTFCLLYFTYKCPKDETSENINQKSNKTLDESECPKPECPENKFKGYKLEEEDPFVVTWVGHTAKDSLDLSFENTCFKNLNVKCSNTCTK
jgi:regulatory protein YycI of two-component signal transduction system YycFG